MSPVTEKSPQVAVTTMLTGALEAQSKQLKDERLKTQKAFGAYIKEHTAVSKTQADRILQLEIENQQIRVQAKQNEKVLREALRATLEARSKTVRIRDKTWEELTPNEKAGVEEQRQQKQTCIREAIQNFFGSSKNWYSGTPMGKNGGTYDGDTDSPPPRYCSCNKIPLTKPDFFWMAYGHLLEELKHEGKS